MFSHAYDIFVFALALGIPAYVIFRVDQLWAAIPLAAIIAWLSIYFGGRVLAAAHPVQHPSYLDTVWLRTGWIAGLGYALFLLSFRLLVHYLRKRHV